MKEFHLPFRVTSRLLYILMFVLAGGFTLLAIVSKVFSLAGGTQLLGDIGGWVFVIFAGLYMYNRQIQKKEALDRATQNQKETAEAGPTNDIPPPSEGPQNPS